MAGGFWSQTSRYMTFSSQDPLASISIQPLVAAGRLNEGGCAQGQQEGR